MLNLTSDLEAVATAREPFSMGACLPSAVIRPALPPKGAPALPPKGAIVLARPRAFWAIDGSGRRHAAAGLSTALGQPTQRKQNYPYSTRIAASGGAKGPHPAREPDPV
jgi:hypothetical protein